jgi:hypothetical protein
MSTITEEKKGGSSGGTSSSRKAEPGNSASRVSKEQEILFEHEFFVCSIISNSDSHELEGNRARLFKRNLVTNLALKPSVKPRLF